MVYKVCKNLVGEKKEKHVQRIACETNQSLDS